MNDDLPRFEAAIRRWAALLNGFGRPDDVAAALSDDALVERYGFGPNRGRLVERIHGPEHVRRWADMSPREARFELTSEVEVEVDDDGTIGHAGYRITVPLFENFGRWSFRLADDGRIRWLAHVPNDIEESHPEGRHGAPWRDLLVGDDGLLRDDHDDDG